MSSHPPSLPPPLPRHDVPQSSIIILSVAALGIVGLITITLLVLYAPLDRDVLVLVTVIVGFLGATGAALLGFSKASEATENVRELHVAVDGRLTALLEKTSDAAAAAATVLANDAERERTAAATVAAAQAAATAAAQAAAATAMAVTTPPPPRDTGP